MSAEYSKVGTTSLGAWEDVVIAVRVMGVNHFVTYFGFVTYNIFTPRADQFFVTYNGNIESSPSKNYIVQYSDGTALPNAYVTFYSYVVRAAPLTDGSNSIVLGSLDQYYTSLSGYWDTLPILGKINNIISLQGTLISTSLYQSMISIDSRNVLSRTHMYKPPKKKHKWNCAYIFATLCLIMHVF